MKLDKKINDKKVLTLGPRFSYSYNLARGIYEEKDIVCLGSIYEVFEKVSEDDGLVGIVPVENMINGSVRETLVSLEKYKVKINKAFDYGICHVLASKSGEFKEIFSHEQALAQSSNFLKKYRDNGVAMTSVASTSKALELASENDTAAAIGSEIGARHYGLNIIARDIGDSSNNITRFIEIGKTDSCSGGNKTSMIIEPKKDRAGLLFEILSVFKIKNINLSKIESLPKGDKIGNYAFYIDVDASCESSDFVDAVEFLETFVDVYLCGCYDLVKVD